ncbi:hypothetical protein [Sandaracinus amylolyticus]|uniref:hypothetical protein n=1 Tax=Sandaracinus amylolyticus TaxID=927083 RepID=UPI001F4506DF|nr:hypothetical protein [Sandaracinus amylolyticus]UJR79591.1 Hypothetical protein I5071_16270 [Sandaracinus amylolyticus]
MRRHVVVIVGIALACIGLALGLSRLAGRGRPATALAAAPQGATAVLHVDVPALRASPIWRALADGDAGLERIVDACGFDPLSRIQSVAAFVLGTEERPFEHLGFVARGDLPRERLVECVQRVVEADGGAIQRVSIEGVPAIASAHGPSRAAFLGGDGIVGGDELVVRELIRVDRGEAPGADTDPALARLWSRVAGRRELIAVAHVPPNWREWLGRLGADVDLDALESVRTIAIGARIERGLGLTIAAEGASPADAGALIDEARAAIDALRSDPLLGLSPLGAALRRVQLESHEGTALATLDLDEGQLASIVQLVRDLLDRRRIAAERAREERVIRAPRPDESLRAGEEAP